MDWNKWGWVLYFGEIPWFMQQIGCLVPRCTEFILNPIILSLSSVFGCIPQYSSLKGFFHESALFALYPAIPKG